MDYSDCQTVHQSVAVLDPSAKMSNMTEGTKFPTTPLVLLITNNAEKPTLKKPWDKTNSFGVLTLHLQAARRAFIEDLRSRSFDNLPSEVRSFLIPSTFLDPSPSNIYGMEGTAGLRLLRETWCTYKGPAYGLLTIVEHCRVLNC